jgi:hypothetical protein
MQKEDHTWTEICKRRLEFLDLLQISELQIQKVSPGKALLVSNRIEGLTLRNFAQTLENRPDDPARQRFLSAVEIIGDLSFLAAVANQKGEWHLEERIARYRVSMRQHLERTCQALGADLNQAIVFGLAAVKGTKAISQNINAIGK